jgi:hypothetical protein
MGKTDLVTRVHEGFDNDVANHVYMSHEIRRVRWLEYKAANVDRAKVTRKVKEAAKLKEIVEAEREFKKKKKKLGQ